MKILSGSGSRIERPSTGGAAWTGVVVVSATEPARHEGTIWLDTAATGVLGNVRTVVTLTTSTTLDLTHDVVLVDATSGAVTITLPAAGDRAGKQYNIKKIDTGANAVTIDGNGSETIDDTTTKILSSFPDAAEIVSDGSEWWIL